MSIRVSKMDKYYKRTSKSPIDSPHKNYMRLILLNKNLMRMNDCLVIYIEKDVFAHVDNEKIMQRFQKMKNRRGLLAPLSVA